MALCNSSYRSTCTTGGVSVRVSYTQAQCRSRLPLFKARQSVFCSHMQSCSPSRIALPYSSNRKQEGKSWQRGQIYGCCAGFDWSRVNFLHRSYMGLCFGFVLETVLIIQECFSYCWAVLTQRQGLFCSEHLRWLPAWKTVWLLRVWEFFPQVSQVSLGMVLHFTF